MSTSIGRLLRRTSLKPGESIMSLNIRLNKLNYVFSPWLLNQICRDPADHSPASFLFPSQTKTFENLSGLTRISPNLLYLATPHVFASVMSSPEVINPLLKLSGSDALPLMTIFTARRRFRGNQRVQYCPKCLEANPYHRLAWIPITVTACLIHQCLLVDHCLRCGRALTIHEIVKCTCTYCNAELREASTIYLRADSIGYISQTIIQSWLGLFELTDTQVKSWGIPNKSPRTLFRVLDGLVNSSIDTGGWKHICNNQSLSELNIQEEHFFNTNPQSTEGIHQYLAYAMQGIIHWPYGFLKFINSCASQYSTKRQYTLGSLGILYSQWIADKWQGKEFDFVHHAFEEFLLNPDNHCHPKLIFGYSFRCEEFSQRYKYMMCSEAAKALNISPIMVKKLVEYGKLQQYHKPVDSSQHLSNFRQSRNHLLLDRQEVLELRARWKNTFTMKEAEQRLGISKAIIIEMTKLEIIIAERGPIIEGSHIWLFSKSSIIEFLDRIQKQLLRGKEIMSMRSALHILAPLGIKSAAILDLASNGILGCKYATGKNGLRNLLFDGRDVRSLRERFQAKNGWVSRKEASILLCVKDSVLKKWVKIGLLSPIHKMKNVQYFIKEDLDLFYDRYIFCDEAAKIIGVGSLVIQKWVRNGRLRPVSGPGIDNCHRYLFLRSNVEQLTPDKRRTTSQLARDLGKSRSQIVQWIKEGKVKPVSGPGIDKSGHYLFVT